MVIKQVTLAAAKARLSALLDEVESGRTIVITRRHRPVAEVRPVRSAGSRAGARPAGLCQGEFTVPDDFDEPLPDAVLKSFEER
jgi:prevent-host-death family protein